MTERENFLERWSRKKAEAEREAAEAPEPPAAPDAPPGPTEAAKAGSVELADRRAGSTSPAPPAPKPEFDLATLPSLESITAVTDIRPFLTAGVPQELTRAALRRAWLADPSIRDFVGLAENNWDFTNPAAIPGFGDIPPGYDIKKMIAEIFGEAGTKREEAPTIETVTAAQPDAQVPPATEESPAARAAAPADEQPEFGDARVSVRPPGATEDAHQQASDHIVHHSNDTATHQNVAEAAPAEHRGRRQHGGALPQS